MTSLPSRGIIGARGSVRRSWVLFVLTFAAFQGLSDWAGPALWNRLTSWTAHLTVWALRLIGAEARVDGTLVISSVFNLNIIGECTALHPIMIYVAAVVACPGRFKTRVAGILAGVTGIVLVNAVRLVSLCYVGRLFPEAFDVVHKILWQSLMIFFTVLFWIVWTMVVAPRYEHRAA